MRINFRNPTKGQKELFQLSSLWWKRLFVRVRCQDKCELCGERKGVNLHHKTYAREGHELPEDLAFLCRYCHEAIHGIWLGWNITSTRDEPLGGYWPRTKKDFKRMIAESNRMARAATATRLLEAEEKARLGGAR